MHPRARVHVLTLAVLGTAACASTTVPSTQGAVNAPTASSGAIAPADPEAMADFDEADRTLAAAAGDCGAACNALAAMTDARIRLCSPRTDACDDAERREGDAKRNVLATCGACGGGE